MCSQDDKDFSDFVIIADRYADNFLMENIGIIESRCGKTREYLHVEDLKKIYIMHEFLYYKKTNLCPIDEKHLYKILQSIGDNEYMKVLKRCCKKNGDLKPSSNCNKIVDYMIQYNLNTSYSNQMIKG